MKKILLIPLLALSLIGCHKDTKLEQCLNSVLGKYNQGLDYFPPLTDYGYTIQEIKNLEYTYAIEIYTNTFVDKWISVYEEPSITSTLLIRISA